MKLAIIGLGNMGQAILAGIAEKEVVPLDKIIVADKRTTVQNKLQTKYSNLQFTTDNKKAAQADYIILAVKPQVIRSVLEEIREVNNKQIIISIAAGVKMKLLNRYLGEEAKIIRVMPNTPALVGAGMSVLNFSASVLAEEKDFVQSIFAALGLSKEASEEDMDAVTGLSGSGPAFVYLFIEALADAGVLKGLNRETALQLAAQTVKGSAEMVLKTDKHPAELKDMVTSPAGTTIAGVAALEAAGFRSAVIEAVTKATERSEELGK
ncbi:pyrroline-5-carboxylate reductase [Halanaerobium salsuginis]|jgi:pyrroline-5-carboxylate reductase|uniref:Pyrroline-5-carboxylate reductase n=1 Tax=Halanaerobium salsuginis TaxID=29563 RepID=A0A1I4H6M4_9FIRM|nr:pyrroline-5-carboxylate reductase [Halanaerobium salsuginis]SFL37939.1 pyrroline-5-carboxylate reductase [Halanaerobium salsuginis]